MKNVFRFFISGIFGLGIINLVIFTTEAGMENQLQHPVKTAITKLLICLLGAYLCGGILGNFGNYKLKPVIKGEVNPAYGMAAVALLINLVFSFLLIEV